MAAPDSDLHEITRRDGFFSELDRFLRGTVAEFNADDYRTIPPDSRERLVAAGLRRVRDAKQGVVRDLAFDLLDGTHEGDYLRDRFYAYLEHFVGMELDRILSEAASGVADPEREDPPSLDVVGEELREVEETILEEAWRALVRFADERLDRRLHVVAEEGDPVNDRLPATYLERLNAAERQERKNAELSEGLERMEQMSRDGVGETRSRKSQSDEEDDVSGDDRWDEDAGWTDPHPDDVDAHEAFEEQQVERIERLLASVLVGKRAYYDPRKQAPQQTGPMNAYIELTRPAAEELSSELVADIDEDVAWGLIGRLYADRGVADPLYEHLGRICRDFDRMMVDAHGNEAAEATKLQAEMALRRFIVDHDLPRRDRQPAETVETEGMTGRDPDDEEAVEELAEAARETSEEMEGRYRACMAEHPGPPEVECRLPAGHDGKHKYAAGQVSYEWPQDEPPSQTSDEVEEGEPIRRFAVIPREGSRLGERCGGVLHINAAAVFMEDGMIQFLGPKGEVWTSINRDMVEYLDLEDDG